MMLSGAVAFGLGVVALGGMSAATAPTATAPSLTKHELRLTVTNPNPYPVKGLPLVVRLGQLALPSDTDWASALLSRDRTVEGGQVMRQRVPHQVDDLDGQKGPSDHDEIVFLADLPARGEAVYRLQYVTGPGAPPVVTEPAFRLSSRNDLLTLVGKRHVYRFKKWTDTHATLVLVDASQRGGRPWMPFPFPNVETWGETDLRRRWGWQRWSQVKLVEKPGTVDVRPLSAGPVRTVLKAVYRSSHGLFHAVRLVAVYGRVGRVVFRDITTVRTAGITKVELARRVGVRLTDIGPAGFHLADVPTGPVSLDRPLVQRQARWVALRMSPSAAGVTIAAGPGTDGQVHLRVAEDTQAVSVPGRKTSLRADGSHEMTYELVYRPSDGEPVESAVPEKTPVVRTADRRLPVNQSPRWVGIRSITYPDPLPSGPPVPITITLHTPDGLVPRAALRWRLHARSMPVDARDSRALKQRPVQFGRRPVTGLETKLWLDLTGLGSSEQPVLECGLRAGAWEEVRWVALPAQRRVTATLVPDGPAVWAMPGQKIEFRLRLANRQSRPVERLQVRKVRRGLYPWETFRSEAIIQLGKLDAWQKRDVTIPVSLAHAYEVLELSLAQASETPGVAPQVLVDRRVVLGMRPEDHQRLLDTETAMVAPWRQAPLNRNTGDFQIVWDFNGSTLAHSRRAARWFSVLKRLGVDAAVVGVPREFDFSGLIYGRDHQTVAVGAGNVASTWLGLVRLGIIPTLGIPRLDTAYDYPAPVGPPVTDGGYVFANPPDPTQYDLVSPRTRLNLQRVANQTRLACESATPVVGHRPVVLALAQPMRWGLPERYLDWSVERNRIHGYPIVDVGATQARFGKLPPRGALHLPGQSDYVLKEFRVWVRDRYDDKTPDDDTNDDRRTFAADTGLMLEDWDKVSLPGLADRAERPYLFYLWMLFRDGASADLQRLLAHMPGAVVPAPADVAPLGPDEAITSANYPHRLRALPIALCQPQLLGGAITALGAVDRALKQDPNKVAWCETPGWELAEAYGLEPGHHAIGPAAVARGVFNAFGRLDRMRGVLVRGWNSATVTHHHDLERVAWLARLVEALPDFFDKAHTPTPRIAVYWSRESIPFELTFHTSLSGLAGLDDRHVLDHWGPTALAYAGYAFHTLFADDVRKGALDDYQALYLYSGARIPTDVLARIEKFYHRGGCVFACYDALTGRISGEHLTTFRRIFGAIPSMVRTTEYEWSNDLDHPRSATFLRNHVRQYRIATAHPALPPSGVTLPSLNGLTTYRIDSPRSQVGAVYDGDPCIVVRPRAMAVGTRLGLDTAGLCPDWMKWPGHVHQMAVPSLEPVLFDSLVRLQTGFAYFVGVSRPVYVQRKKRDVYNVFVGLLENVSEASQLIVLTENAGRGGTYTVRLMKRAPSATVRELTRGAEIARVTPGGFDVTLAPYDIQVLAVGPPSVVARLADAARLARTRANLFVFDGLNRQFMFGLGGTGRESASCPWRQIPRPRGIIVIPDHASRYHTQLAKLLKDLVETAARQYRQPGLVDTLNLPKGVYADLSELRADVRPASRLTPDEIRISNLVLLGEPLANDLTARLLKEGKLTDPDGDGIWTYMPQAAWRGGCAIAFPVRSESDFRRLSTQLKQHMALWF